MHNFRHQLLLTQSTPSPTSSYSLYQPPRESHPNYERTTLESCYPELLEYVIDSNEFACILCNLPLFTLTRDFVTI